MLDALLCDRVGSFDSWETESPRAWLLATYLSTRRLPSQKWLIAENSLKFCCSKSPYLLIDIQWLYYYDEMMFSLSLGAFSDIFTALWPATRWWGLHSSRFTQTTRFTALTAERIACWDWNWLPVLCSVLVAAIKISNEWHWHEVYTN